MFKAGLGVSCVVFKSRCAAATDELLGHVVMQSSVSTLSCMNNILFVSLASKTRFPTDLNEQID